MKYEDFRRLIEDRDNRKAVAPLLDQWFGYSVVGERPDVFIRNKVGKMIDPLWLHLRIQNDPAQQQTWYNTAMSLWR